MAKLTFDTNRCKGCGLCVEACPKGLLAIARDKINQKGHHPAEITDQEKCARLRHQSGKVRWKHG